MWEQRLFLIVLKRAEEQQKSFLTTEKYADARKNGMSFYTIVSIVFDNRNLFLIGLIALKWKKIKYTEDLNEKEKEKSILEISSHSAVDFFEKTKCLIETCHEEEYIYRSKPNHIKIKRKGKRFVEFVPFYNSLLEKYGAIVGFFLGGGAVTLIWILNYILNR